jgi:inhibitor of KinA
LKTGVGFKFQVARLRRMRTFQVSNGRKPVMNVEVNRDIKPRVYALSERALVVEVGEEISGEVFGRVMAVHRAMEELALKGVVDVVAAYTTVTVVFDPVVIHRFFPGEKVSATEKVREQVEVMLDGLAAIDARDVQAELVVIPVCYDVEFALDLSWVAQYHQTTEEEIIRRHAAHTFTVFMIGFTPGFPYMGVLPQGLESPRKVVPRTHVPAGSVGLAGKQTGIYPYTTPGGWQIIGRTPQALFDPRQQRPARLKAGDRVKFEAISKDEFNRMRS